MAIDTENKRRLIAGVLPVPNNDVGANDRKQVLRIYFLEFVADLQTVDLTGFDLVAVREITANVLAVRSILTRCLAVRQVEGVVLAVRDLEVDVIAVREIEKLS